MDVAFSTKDITDYYKRFEREILRLARESIFLWEDPYAFDWTKIFTPIETEAWHCIRGTGRIVLYPQYPVLNYRLDFGNPFLKIGLECDGKDYHDVEKDKERDAILWEYGWKIFRAPGSEWVKCNRPDEFKDIEWDSLEQYYSSDAMHDFYVNSGEGLVESLKLFYFDKERYKRECRVIQGYVLESLEKHRLIDFPL